MAEPPPILYRVRPGSKIEKAYKSEYGYERSLKGFSSKPWSLSGAAQQSIGFRSSRIMRMTGTTPSLAKRVAVKQLAFEGELEEVISHPILDLLSRPNGWYQTSYVEFVHAWGLSMLLAGEIFTEPITNASEGKAPDQLFVLPAHRMRPGRGTEANPIPKWFQTGRSSDSWTYSPDPMETEIFFNKLYDPINPLRGLSPMEATVRSVDLNNQARAWNLTFLQNAAVPPALVTGEFDAPGAEAIREEYSENLAGASNAGNIITLSGKNLKYEQLSMDAAKLMWGDVIEMTAKEVAIVFGVPPEILGDSSNKTYSNYQEARLALYQDRILPACDFMFSSWNSSWVRRFGEENLVLDYDTDQILAIAADVQKIYDRLKSASFLTFNEKREAVGYPRTDGGDVILIPITMIPLDMVSEGDVDGLKSHIAYVAKMLASENISIDGNNGIE
jgi:HK97 family phage portal protein